MMLLWKQALAAAVVFLGLAGCVTNEAIIAGAVDTVGISASGGATDQGTNLVVGFKGTKFAVVPVQTNDGKLLATKDGPDKQRGYSVIAVLGIDAPAGAKASGGIHQVVAIGKPADLWALGQSRKAVMLKAGDAQ